MSDIQPGLPRKVLAHMSEVGVHVDCLVASANGISHMCRDCYELTMLVLDHFYGGVSKEPGALEQALKDDIIRDRMQG